MSDQLSDVLLSQLSEFVADRLGLHFPQERWPDLERGMRSVTRELEFEDIQSCVHSFISLPVTQRQIEALAGHLTVGETYFFREGQSFQALEEHVLPQLIENRRGRDQRLRIWSAGCCTGEEPYSIAMLLRRMLCDLKDWQISILATDINPCFLKRAADGIYGEWSFRGVPPGFKQRYFAKKPNGRFEILPEIKRMVTFSYLNLVEDIYPSLLNSTNAMDIILCRNVLMYFASKRAKQVIREFHVTLLDGGWLIVSPSETSHYLYSQFVAVNFPGAIFYKKDSYKTVEAWSSCSLEEQTKAPVWSTLPLSLTPPPEPEIPVAKPIEELIASDISEPKRVEPRQALYAKSLDLYEQGLYEEAARMLSTFLAREPADRRAMALLARVYANQGKLTEATQWCEKAVTADKLDPAGHILHAAILQEQGAILKARQSLQRALYLDQNLVLAHFALGNIARQQGKVREATRHFENARVLLSTYSPEQILPESEGMTAGRLMEIIRSTHGAELSAITPRQRGKSSTVTARKRTAKEEPQ